MAQVAKVKQKILKASSSSSLAPPPSPPPWVELPAEITVNILQRVGAIEILRSAQRVCSTWWNVCQDPTMWHVIDMKNHGIDIKKEVFKNICRVAVDRSQGQLISINIEDFCDRDLLNYIAHRSVLKRLSIACCYDMVCENLVEVAQKLPLLEKLSLTHTSITTEDIEALGRFCPQLKSFEFNTLFNMELLDDFDEEDERNDEALAIAKNLPALRHLRLIGNSMTNKGLQAILDGCPYLESLDLRHCFDVSLNEVLISKISGQIKDVKHPHDSFALNEYGMSDDIYDDYVGF